MRLQLTIGKDLYQIEVDRAGDVYQVIVNGKPFQVKPVSGGFAVGGATHAVKVLANDGGTVRAEVAGKAVEARILDVAKAAARKAEEATARAPVVAAVGVGKRAVVAPMPGKIVKILAAVGQAVPAGAPLLVLEAMKMQNEIPAPAAGVVREVRVQEGQSVLASDVLVVLEPA